MRLKCYYRSCGYLYTYAINTFHSATYTAESNLHFAKFSGAYHSLKRHNDNKITIINLFTPFWSGNPIRQYGDILGKQRTIQPIHANERQRKQLIRTYRMDKHYIPGKLIFFVCFHLCLNPHLVLNNTQFSVLSSTYYIQSLINKQLSELIKNTFKEANIHFNPLFAMTLHENTWQKWQAKIWSFYTCEY